MSRTWTKRHSSRLNDLRFDNLHGEAEQVYDRLYILAGLLDVEGLFVENGKKLSNEEIAYRVRLPINQVSKELIELQKRKLIYVNGKGPLIIDWKHQQTDLIKIRQQTKERVTRYRERVTKGTALQSGVTPLEREETQTQIKKETLLLLSPEQREKVSAHPEWMEEALKLSTTKNKLSPDYIAGILKNFIVEKPDRRNSQGKSSSKKLDGKQKKL